MAENKTEWTEQLRDLTDRIVNREKFDFDVNGEALMKQYQDQFRRQGKTAMMDTMGQAQAMTGGYGNSYAQSVGQQTYQNYMQGATDKIPELYQLALSKYQAEGSDLMDKFSILADRESSALGQSRYAQEKAEEQRRYEQEWAEDQRRYNQEWEENLRRYEQEWAAAHPEISGTAGSSGSGANWLRSDGSVNMNMVSQSSPWWKDYAARNGLDPKTGKPLDTGTDWESEYMALKAVSTGREMDAYLKERVAVGDMTQEEANELRNKRP